MSNPAATDPQDPNVQHTSGQSHHSPLPAPSLDRHHRLADWVVGHGGFIHPDLVVQHHPDKGFHAIVRHGKELPAQTRIATCSMGVTLSVLNVLSIDPFENHGTRFPDPFLHKYQFSTDVLQAFFLMEQYVLKERSFWAPYIEVLPTVQEVDDLEFETDADVAWIHGTNLEAAFASQRRKWKDQFEEASSLLASSGWENARNGKYTYRLYRWASSIFGSRSFTSQVMDDTAPADRARPLGRRDPDYELLSRLFSERFAVLLPLLDILNHRPAALVEWQAEINHVGLQIEQSYDAGQEVCNNYGPRDNEGLLMSYGFVLEDNPFEHVLISINAHPGTPLEIARNWPMDDRSNDNFNCYIFDISHPIVKEAKYLERALFSYDLLDSISVMCSNDREFQAMSVKQETLMSTCLPTGFDDFRNVLATLAQIMLDCRARAERMQATDPSRANPPIQPRNQKQRNAQIYRQKQASILRASEGVCAFALLNASTNEQAKDLIEKMRTKFPEVYTPELEDICTRLRCLTSKNELFTATRLMQLLPPAETNSIRSCLKEVETTILESVPDHVRSHDDRVRTSFSITLSALCCAYRAGIQLSRRLRIWIEELTSSYPPEDPNWSYVPSPGPYAPGEEPPPALTVLLGTISRVANSSASNRAIRAWLEPRMICWAWNVMEEEIVRVPIEIERFVSQSPEQVQGSAGFMMYCKQYT